MIVCKVCGATNEQGATFCGTCGAFLEWSGEQVQPEGAPQGTGPAGDPPPVPNDPPIPYPINDPAPVPIPPTPEPVPEGSIVCPNCGQVNESTRVYCSRCATELAAVAIGTDPVVAPAAYPAQDPARRDRRRRRRGGRAWPAGIPRLRAQEHAATVGRRHRAAVVDPAQQQAVGRRELGAGLGCRRIDPAQHRTRVRARVRDPAGAHREARVQRREGRQRRHLRLGGRRREAPQAVRRQR